MKITLGGDRVGSGKKVRLDLHNYFRSTHDLSQTWTSPMTVGALYPFLVIPAMRNDKFEITLDCDTITVPTKGPLFGSFKLQTDVYACPVRLYQAILHNNPTNIGLKMNQVLFPIYELSQDVTSKVNHLADPVNNSCLWKYLGLSGLGKGGIYSSGDYTIKREINAIPLLAYYDIFKNYYSNKQEDKAYVISGKAETEPVIITDIKVLRDAGELVGYSVPAGNNYTIDVLTGTRYFEITAENIQKFSAQEEENIFYFEAVNDEDTTDSFSFTNVDILDLINNQRVLKDADTFQITNAFEFTLVKKEETKVTFALHNNVTNLKTLILSEVGYVQLGIVTLKKYIKLENFDLKNIDDMRMEILSHHTLGSPYKVSSFNKLPYNVNTHEKSQYPLNGLVVKTYQSDIFNNWVNTEWIDGENGIAEITKIATSDGAFKLDQLNLAEKLYNMLNRVAVSGGTYEDWQDAVYDEAPHKHIESPIYLGGMSSEIVFEQIVANTAATTPEGQQPLGDLAGRGRYIKRKGGHISVKCDEACFIIGIVSITPRIKYTQGNEFYLTELKSMDDLHKPALDGIGFQNLLGERLAWFDTTQGNDGKLTRSVVGKLPAWIEYMTAVDKTYGDFAEEDGKAFMSLNRNYEMDENGDIKDATTYIDPTKYNYAFAYSELDAQNFWTEIYSKVIARRKMSAKQIPNL